MTAILQNEVGWFDLDENNSSLLASQLATDATLVRAAVADRMSTFMQNMALTATAFAIAFYLEWRVTVVILATFPLLIGASVGEVFRSSQHTFAFLLSQALQSKMKLFYFASDG